MPANHRPAEKVANLATFFVGQILDHTLPYDTVHGGEDRGDHPATFPVEVAERCIKLAGIKPGMKVLDPICVANGMTAAA